MTLPDHVSDLPIASVASAVCESLKQGNVVLQAEPGAGKSTGLPLALLQSGFAGKILMLEPRRIAARNVAARLASQLGESVGQSIGLRMRGETRVSKNTRLEVVTEGVLTRLLQSDPLLDGVAVIIFDEFHERSLHADLGLTLCLDSQRAVRDDLRLLLMSATLESELLCNHLGVSEPITCHVRQHPVDIIWTPFARVSVEQAVVKTVTTALKDQAGDLLVFLPGVAEIEKTARQLDANLPADTTLHRLHSGVSAKAQSQATAANTGQSSRRVILSTSIAETSITIDGVRVVIDAGLERRSKIDAASGIERLETVMASKASATQRAGRAGRTQSGVCYRLWSEESHGSRAASWQPEILRADLSSLLLELGLWGAADVDSLPWIEAPSDSAIDRATKVLQQLGIWNESGLTEHGRAVARLPLHPRLGHMLLWATKQGAGSAACVLAAVLEDLPRTRSVNFNETLLRPQATHKRRAAQLGKLCNIETDDAVPGIDASVLLARAYPERIAKRRAGSSADHNTSYLLSGGSGAIVSNDDPITQSDYIVAASMGGKERQARIFSALPVDIALLRQWCNDLIETKDKVEWDEKRERVVAERQQCIGAIVLESQTIQNVDKSQRSAALINTVRRKGLDCLSWNNDVREWQSRVTRMRSLEGDDTSYPAVDDAALLDSLEHWLQPYVNDITSLKALKQIDLLPLLVNQLDYKQQQHLEDWLPQKYQVPSGASHHLRYDCEGNPVLSVKLQEMFGCRENPSVAGGRVPLKVELLSPARRPVQVTEDLANFWHNSYASVKKDMAGRYPKHPWPDDPVNAVATAYTKARQLKSQ